MQTVSESGVTETICSHLRPADLNARLIRGDPIEIIDVREFVEFAAGHIVSARLVPLSELEARSHELNRSIPLVCVCRSGKRSVEAVSKLLALGFHNVAQLEGGIMAWQEQGFPLTSVESAPWSLERQVRFFLGFFRVNWLGSFVALARGYPYILGYWSGHDGHVDYQLVRNGAVVGQSAMEQATRHLLWELICENATQAAGYCWWRGRGRQRRRSSATPV